MLTLLSSSLLLQQKAGVAIGDYRMPKNWTDLASWLDALTLIKE